MKFINILTIICLPILAFCQKTIDLYPNMVNSTLKFKGNPSKIIYRNFEKDMFEAVYEEALSDENAEIDSLEKNNIVVDEKLDLREGKERNKFIFEFNDNKIIKSWTHLLNGYIENACSEIITLNAEKNIIESIKDCPTMVDYMRETDFQHYTFEYDKNGKQSKRKQFNLNNELTKSSELSYIYKDGYIIEEIIITNGQNSVKTYSNRIEDTANMRYKNECVSFVFKEGYGANIEKCECDIIPKTENFIRKSYNYWGGTESKYLEEIFDKLGRLLNKKYGFQDKNTSYHEEIYTYSNDDKQVDITRSIVKNAKIDSIRNDYFYQFDNEYKIISKQDNDGFHTYEYDKNGNVIKYTLSPSKGGNPKQVEIWDIIYK